MTVAVTARTAGKVTLNVIGDRLITTISQEVQPGVDADPRAGRPRLGQWRLRRRDAAAPARRGRRSACPAAPSACSGSRSTARRRRSRSSMTAAGTDRGPTRTLRVPVKVDGPCAGEEARVVVAAVDVGILNLTNYKPPAPDDYLSRPAPARRRNPRPLRPTDRRHAGHARPDPQRRRRAPRRTQGSPPTQPPLALYSGVVTVGRDGNAEVAFDIPDFAGRCASWRWPGARTRSAAPPAT